VTINVDDSNSHTELERYENAGPHTRVSMEAHIECILNTRIRAQWRVDETGWRAGLHQGHILQLL